VESRGKSKRHFIAEREGKRPLVDFQASPARPFNKSRVNAKTLE
jgi:hypothetical protein